MKLFAGLFFSLLVSFSFAQALEKSPILKSHQIEVRPVTLHMDRLLVPVMKKETAIGPVFLAGDEENPIKLEAVGDQPQKISAHYDPENFWVFKNPRQKHDKQGAYFVLIGTNAKSLAKFYSKYHMSMGGPVPDCALPDNGYISTDVEVLKLQKGINNELVYISASLLRSTFEKMTSDKRESGTWYINKIVKVNEKGPCLTLIHNTSDGDGQNNKGDADPMGKILGIMKLTKEAKSEIWVVTEGHGYETHGITFIRIPGSPAEKIDRQFVFSHGL